jgi:hypothetical protein
MTHERTELEVKEISFTLMTANGIWSIENHNFNVMTTRSFQAQRQGGTEGVDAGTNILQINYQNVNMGEHGVGGLAGLAVEAEHRDAQILVNEIIGLYHISLLFTKITMLWGKNGGKFYSGLQQSISGMSEAAVYRGLIGQ